MIVSNKQKIIVIIKTQYGDVELPCIALISKKSIEKGLMFLKRMSRKIGVFFVFEKSGYNKMWMKNTYLPLDIIFISEKGIITEIVQGKPMNEQPIGGYITNKYAIEVIEGFCKENNILTGQRIEILDLSSETYP